MKTDKTQVHMAVYVDGWSGSVQLAIEDDIDGGYRLLGPKFNSSGTLRARRALSVRDANEIRRYLDRAFPVKKVKGQQ